MAHKEACQLFIEQEIKDGLAQGKTPYSIGKELAAWVEKLFETSIPATTIEKRAERARATLPTNVGKPTTPINHTEIPEKPSDQQVRDAKGKFEKGTTPGPSRLPKHAEPPKTLKPYSNAVYLAEIAISQLSRIEPNDPKREKAFQKVINWINEQLGRTI